ncbi:oligoendopeptidase F [Campylobacter sp. RM5004]|uniref:M3 family oligoendopeptidase n=1 Tax=Campylobacter sp. RM5004 TaxID=1660078 RepID=UPI001EFA8DE1|nr:M3 family oligoendopeptidase [Campylobacter sp. RM5004]ULO02148.1 oligoendopeptidase F [Campylobacter sp. RM5004]
MEWDLSIIYKNKEDLYNNLKDLEKRADDFASKYENKLNECVEFEIGIKELENIYEGLSKAGAYAYLNFAKDSSNGAFLQEISEICTKISSKLVFFEIEFCELENAQEIANKSSEYSYMLNNWLKSKKYQLSKSNEQIFMKMSVNGNEAFSRLFDEYLSNITFKLDLEKISEEELLSKLYSPDRALRKRAADALTKGLKKNIKTLSFIFNMIKNHHKTECELRGYENPLRARNLSNQISDESVMSLIKVAESNYHLVEKYYNKKREILGLKELKDYDRYAPLYSDTSNDWDFEKSCKVVKDTFNKFSPKFADIMQKALNNHALDVYPAKNKRGGAFSYGINPQPFVMLNHTNNQRDLFTLAHELGHLIHQSLAGQKLGYFNANTPLTTAETASVFAEMLTYDAIKDTLSAKEKKALLASKIEDIFATFFRQINFTNFEIALHNHEGELSVDELCDLWLAEGQKMFGSSVKLRKKYKYWFSYIPHFIHSPFYCYAYSYAQLLVLALFGLYKSGKCPNFVDIYTEFLASGGSKSPAELVALFGLDLNSDEFWQLGINEISKMVQEFCE